MFSHEMAYIGGTISAKFYLDIYIAVWFANVELYQMEFKNMLYGKYGRRGSCSMSRIFFL